MPYLIVHRTIDGYSHQLTDSFETADNQLNSLHDRGLEVVGVVFYCFNPSSNCVKRDVKHSIDEYESKQLRECLKKGATS